MPGNRGRRTGLQSQIMVEPEGITASEWTLGQLTRGSGGSVKRVQNREAVGAEARDEGYTLSGLQGPKAHLQSVIS